VQSTLSRPYVVSVVPATPTEATPTTAADLLIGAASMAGVMLAVALVLGAVLGGVRLGYRKFFPPGEDHMPPVSPYEPDVRHPSQPPPQ
jgi:hypothetical protein